MLYSLSLFKTQMSLMKKRTQNQNEADPHGKERTVDEASHPNEPLQDQAQTVMPTNPEEMGFKPHENFHKDA